MHGWYSNLHDLMCGLVIFEVNGKATAITFTCPDKERGEKYIRENFPDFPDYQYVGEVGRCLYEDVLPGDE